MDGSGVIHVKRKKKRNGIRKGVEKCVMGSTLKAILDAHNTNETERGKGGIIIEKKTRQNLTKLDI